MTRYNITGQGEVVPYTPEEEAVADAIEAADTASAPMREWEESMIATDQAMTRDVEDLIDTLILTGILTEEQLPQKLLEGRAIKKAERDKKPV